MIYKISKGVVGKLIHLEMNKDADVKEWTTRKDLAFTECLINPATVVRMDKVGPNDRKPLAVQMALDGYALFGGDTGGDRTAEYVLAVPFINVEIK